jgi:hypothetical protein
VGTLLGDWGNKLLLDLQFSPSSHLKEITVKSLLFVGYQFSWFSWVGRSTKLRIQRTMKLGKQFGIDILANDVLDMSDLHFLEQLHSVQLTILMTK